MLSGKEQEGSHRASLRQIDNSLLITTHQHQIHLQFFFTNIMCNTIGSLIADSDLYQATIVRTRTYRKRERERNRDREREGGLNHTCRYIFEIRFFTIGSYFLYDVYKGNQLFVKKELEQTKKDIQSTLPETVPH